MNKLASRIKPKSGFSAIVHVLLNLSLPALLYVFVRIDVPELAIAMIVLSKWRMFAVRLRYWLANIRANAVDLMVGMSTVVFMTSSSTASWQIAWAAIYAVWLVFIKPGTNTFMVSLQALLAQFAALMALFLVGGGTPLYLLVILSWLICYLCARHFFMSFDEPYTPLLSHVWGFFAASLVWVLGHWLLYYGVLAQPTLLLVVIGYGLAVMYYLDEHDKLTALWRRQFVIMIVAIIAVVLTFSDWGDRAI